MTNRSRTITIEFLRSGTDGNLRVRDGAEIAVWAMLGIVLTRAMLLAFLFLLRSWGKMQTGRLSGGEIGGGSLGYILRDRGDYLWV